MERLTSSEIITSMLLQFTPVWIGMAVILTLSVLFRKKLGLYGKIFSSPVGVVGLVLVLFWVLTAIFADLIATMDPLTQVSGMKNKKPGWPLSGAEGQWYLLGGDNLARDVFSRMVKGSQLVIAIAPAATIFAFMVGITLGLPAGFYGGKFDTALSFLANLVLAFPVILLFFLLVTPEIRSTGLPLIMAGVLFLFPIIFFVMLFYSRFREQPTKLVIILTITLVLGAWAYSGLAFNKDPFGVFYMDPNLSVSYTHLTLPTIYSV